MVLRALKSKRMLTAIAHRLATFAANKVTQNVALRLFLVHADKFAIFITSSRFSHSGSQFFFVFKFGEQLGM